MGAIASETAVFHDADERWMVETESTIDPTRDQGMISGSSLKDFLSRPVKIDNFSLSRNTPLDRTIDPWSQFFENYHVDNKITNFYLFRGKLCIKIIINGSGFYYGHFIVNYVPQAVDDDMDSYVNGDPLDIMGLTVYPHIWLDPTTSRGGEMKLPFYNPHNWISLTEATYSEMGRLHYQDIVQLKHANDLNPFPLRVTTFAWMEDVEVCHTTHRHKAFTTPQAGVGAAVSTVLSANQSSKDEYGEGIVSHASSVVANASANLSSAPVIGTFAKATERTAGTIHKFARFLGFSRPRQINEIIYTQNVDAGLIAATDQHDTSKSLALTSKQELTVDPRVTGLGSTDEMSVNYIAGKEAILSTFAIDPSSAVAEDLLWNSRVTPNLYILQGDEIKFSPMAHVSMPFRWWTGTIIYRFQITASAYHRGRIRVSWDPMDQLSGAADYNINYTRVVDIAQERDFEVAVAWGQFRAWGLVGDYNTPTASVFGTSMVIPRRNQNNGVIAVYLVTEIAVPNTAADDDVFVTVTARAGDDFRLAGPTSEKLSGVYYQSGVGSPVTDGTPGSSEADMEGASGHGRPESTTPITPIGKSQSDSLMYDVYFGEQGCASIRQLLKRYCFVNLSKFRVTGNSAVHRLLGHVLPPTPGNQLPDSLHLSALGSPATYSNMTLLNWFMPSYTGWRGSIRWKHSFVDLPTGRTVCKSIRRGPPAIAASLGLVADELGTTDDTMAHTSLVMGNYFDGGLVNTSNGEGTLETEFPFYSNRRFAPCRRYKNTLSPYSLAKGDCETWSLTLIGDVNTQTAVPKFVSTGEDFSLSFYVGPPRMSVAALPAA